jgi:hypothetical protein
MSIVALFQKILCSNAGNISNVLTEFLVHVYRSFQASNKVLHGEISMHRIFQALAAMWLWLLPFSCVTSSKTEDLPGGIILRNTSTGFEVNLFRYVY